MMVLSADDTKLGGVAGKPKGCAAIQTSRTSTGWQKPHATNANLIQNKGKCKVLGRNSLMHQLLWADLVGNSFGKVLVNSKLNMSQQCVREAAKASCARCIRRSAVSRWNEMAFPLFQAGAATLGAMGSVMVSPVQVRFNHRIIQGSWSRKKFFLFPI